MPIIILVLLFFSLHFAYEWVQKTQYGRLAFVDCPVRYNSMPMWVPFALFSVWVVAMSLTAQIITVFFDPEQSLNEITVSQISLAVSSIVTTAGALKAAKMYFNNGLKGFGLDTSMIKADFKRAVCVLLKVMPIVWLSMFSVTFLLPIITRGRLTVPAHPLIEHALEASSAEKVLVVFLAVVIAPILEEVLFRGFVQTKLSENFQNRWLAIMLGSVFFAVVHGGPLWTHWLALFILSCAFGYVYEKSGSLWQPIFMHALFNAVSMFFSFIL